MKGINILRLTEAPEAAPICAKWLFDEWGHRTPDSTLEQATDRFLARFGDRPIPVAFVAMSGRVVAGTASLVESEGAFAGLSPWISGVFVPEPARGQGIAARLIATVEAEAKRLGFSRLWLSASAPEMYARLGYKITWLRKDGEPVMVKDL